MASLHVRIDDATKKKVQKILDELGLDMSTAVNMYFHQIALRHAIPFEITKERCVPGQSGKSYESDEEMVEDVLLEDSDCL